MAEDTEVTAGSATDGSTPQRRVYALPSEMVERIVEYQREKGFGSEVEAVRRLLDEALKSRDTADKIISRFLARLEVHRVVGEAAKDVLVGHPMIQYLRFDEPDQITFAIKGAPEVTAFDNGRVRVAAPTLMWSSTKPYGAGKIVDVDGEIPF